MACRKAVCSGGSWTMSVSITRRTVGGRPAAFEVEETGLRVPIGRRRFLHDVIFSWFHEAMSS
jgi:hypothetical protein